VAQANARIGCSAPVVREALRHGVEPHQAHRRLLPVYLAIRNPMECPDMDSDWAPLIEKAQLLGHDGICYRNAFEAGGKGLSWIAFRTDQVRSVFDRAFYPGLDAGPQPHAPEDEPSLNDDAPAFG
jgi:hypothetical protein